MREVTANSVLVVDDDPSIRKMLALRLARAGFEVRHAEDGIDAVAKLREHLPNVIISDLDMPRMSGTEFISVMRWRFPSIPVIVLSGSSRGKFRSEVTPDRWFDKNTRHITELLQAVHELVRKTPDPAYRQQVIGTPVRTRPGGAGYFILTCTDCLRSFEMTSTATDKTVDRTAICTYCEARVPFLIESPEPE